MAVLFKEGYTTASEVVKALTKAITTLGDGVTISPVWKLEYPSQISAITDFAVISRSMGTDLGRIYLEIEQPKMYESFGKWATTVPGTGVQRVNHYFVETRIGTKWMDGKSLEPGTETFVDLTKPIERREAWPKDSEGDYVNDSEKSRLSWFMSNTTATIKSWLPVQYWISITPDSIALIVSGDASASFHDRLISFAYFGKVKPFTNPCDGSVVEGYLADESGNFGMCVSSDIAPKYSTRYSDKTGTGVIDLTMLKTASGFPFQAHTAAFTTPDEFVDKALEGPSAWTKKYHMSPAYVFHGFDGYRGEIESILVTDRSAIVHLDDMIVDKGKATQKIYKAFMVNAPYSIFNTSPNVLYGVAILKSEGLTP